MQWGDLITLEYGKPIKDKESVDGPIPVYGTNGQIGTSHLKPLCEHPSFILGRKGAYRGVHYSDTPFSVIDTAFYAQPISDKVDLKWAYYKFLTYDINRMDSGSAIPSTDRYEIYSIDVDLPDLVTQRRVVSVLELLDNKIQDNNKINDNLAVLKFDGGYIQFAGHQFGQKRIPDFSKFDIFVFVYPNLLKNRGNSFRKSAHYCFVRNDDLCFAKIRDSELLLSCSRSGNVKLTQVQI